MRYRYRLDPYEIKFMINRVKKGDTVVDVGAHKGGYLYWLLKCIGQGGLCYAFEPQLRLYKKLQQDFAYSDNVRLERMAVSEYVGTKTLHIPSIIGHSPGATLELLFDRTHSYAVPVTTLDIYFQTRDIVPHFIKIDVEGHELSVLKGGKELLEHHHPVLLVEIENRHLLGMTCLDVFSFVEDLGYQGWFYDRKGKLCPVRTFDSEQHQKSHAGRYWTATSYRNNFLFWGV